MRKILFVPDTHAPFVSIDRGTGCWNWTGSKTRGYGTLRVSGKQQYAHRVTWSAKNGRIPDGLCVCHKCDNPACCNPDHLFLGTRAENSADMVSKGRSTHGGRNPNAKLTEQDVSIIKWCLGAGVRRRRLAALYEISHTAVDQIAQGTRWGAVVAMDMGTAST